MGLSSLTAGRVSVLAPHVFSTVRGPCDCWTATKAFSDSTQAGVVRSLRPAPGWWTSTRPAGPLGACSVQSGYCLDDLFVARLPPSACSFSCSRRGRLETSLSTSIGIHGSAAPSAPSLRYLGQQENPRSPRPCPSEGRTVHDYSAFLPPFGGFPCFFYVWCPEF